MFFVVGLVEMAMGTLIESAVLFPVAKLIAVGAEGFSAMSFWDLFEVPEEG